MEHPSDSALAGLILAGGASQRMGAPKAIMPWGNETFLQAVCQKMRTAGVTPFFAALGAHYREAQTHCRSCEALPIYNERWPLGQFSSLQMGVSRVPPARHAAFVSCSIAGAMIALVDQPHIEINVFAEIARVSRQFPDKLIVPSRNGRRGHPFVIPRRFFPALLAMPLNATTRDFLRAYEAQQVLVPVADEGIHIDLDTPEDLLQATMRFRG
jgi:CTP:molybdopterin cytidylyltransferase MocA